jgi:hypothetical protein
VGLKPSYGPEFNGALLSFSYKFEEGERGKQRIEEEYVEESTPYNPFF